MSQAAPVRGPLVFEEFLAYLRRLGFAIGVDHHLRLQQLLTRMAGECSPQDLRTLLCPIFATNREQQEAFYRAFDSYFDLFLAAPAAAAPISAVMRAGEAPQRMRSPLVQRRWPYLWAAGLLAILFFFLALLITRKRVAIAPPASPVPQEVRSPLPPVPAQPPALREPAAQRVALPAPAEPKLAAPTPAEPPFWARLYEQIHSAIRLTAVVAPLLFYLFYEWYRFSRRRLVLRRQRGKKPPYSWPIRLAGGAANVYQSGEFYTAVRRLNQRQTGESCHLDIEGSIQATVDSLGYPLLAYKLDSKLPEYLVLIDRISFRDHQAELFDRLAKALHDEGLFVTVWFFEGDPRVCQGEGGQDSVPLAELEQKYLGHRLLLFGNGERLVDPVSGKLAAWSAQLTAWQDRAILTPEVPARWGLREKALASQFVVLPATVQGLLALVDHLQQPSVPDPHAAREYCDDPATPEPDHPALVEALRDYLGESAFRWLCACAVYPELHWDLTLHLGSLSCLAKELITEENVLRLIRLPWFRTGAMPDELRWRLIRELDPAQEWAVREALTEMLEGNPAPPETFASDSRRFEIAFHRYWLDRRNRRRRRELAGALGGLADARAPQEYTTLRLLESATDSPFDLLLPRRLRRILYPRGIPAFGLRTAVRALATLAVMGVVWWGTRPVGTVPDRQPPPPESQAVHVEPPRAPEPLPSSLRLITDLEAGRVVLDDQPAHGLQEGELIVNAVPPGKHTLKVASRDGEATLSFETAPAAIPSLSDPVTKNLAALVLANFGSRARLHASFGPASVELDGRPVGQVGPGGLELSDLTPGAHELVVGAGMNHTKMIIDVGPAPTLTAFLLLRSDREVGSVVVVTGEDGVRVFLNGKERLRTTSRGQLRIPNLAVREYRVRVAKEGFLEEPEISIQIRKGEEARLEFKLRPAPTLASLSLSGGPVGAQVLLDRNLVGTVQPDGSFQHSGIELGEHTIELRKDGFQPKWWQRSFAAGQTVRLLASDLVLYKVWGRLQINVTPRDAQLTLSRPGEPPKPITGTSLDLPEGNYALHARAPDHADGSVSVQIAAGNIHRLTLELKRLSKKGPVAPPLSAGMQAEDLFRELKRREKALGAEHLEVAAVLTNLAALYQVQGEYGEAEVLWQRALKIFEKNYGPEHPAVAGILDSLAELYRVQRKYELAEPLAKHAVLLREKALGDWHPDVAASLYELGAVYYSQGKTAEAEPLYRQAVAIWERGKGASPLELATALGQLGDHCFSQGRLEEAERLYGKALAIREEALGKEHSEVEVLLNGLAHVRLAQGKLAEAEPLYRRLLARREKARLPDDAALGPALTGLAGIYVRQGKYAEAEPVYRRLVAIAQKSYGPEHAAVAEALDNYAGFLRKAGQEAEGKKITAQAQAIRNKSNPRLTAKAGGLCDEFRALMSRYPFNPKATVQATIDDFNRFFRPGDGALWNFYSENLQNLIVKEGQQYAAKVGGPMTVNPAFLAFFNRVAAFSDVIYKGGQQPKLAYTLRSDLTGVNQVISLSIDGQTLNNSPGKGATQEFTWPGTPPAGAGLTVKFGGDTFQWPRYDGLWGVFGFLADSEEKAQISSSVYRLQWSMRTNRAGRQVTTAAGQPVSVRFDLDMMGAPPIFRKGYFAGWNCVVEVAR